MNFKLFWNEQKKPFGYVFGFLTFVIAIPSMLIDYKSLLRIMAQNAENVINYLILFIIIMICVIIFLGCLLTKNRTDFHLPNSIRRRHSILIFDDKKVDLNFINDFLQGYGLDYVLLNDIKDYRLAESFEIIIGDILGVGVAKDPSLKKNSISILNTIKEKYPYKIVLAMSNLPPTEVQGLHIDDDIVNKQNKEEFPKVILKLINNYSKILDDVNSHWEQVSKILDSKKISKEEIERIKIEYFQFVKRKWHTDQIAS